ncbi:unnamed protein product [Meganyctiphanes norvegica]|uniref:Uncharacterized protein n=1 Tax=Meganyctiphanes norvegica TaxID=48144 RepID=A0AAV2RD17_MEGNR
MVCYGEAQIQEQQIASAAAAQHTTTNQDEFMDIRQKFLLGTSSTTTYTVVSAATSTVYHSCLSGISSSALCTGRRKKRSNIIKKIDLLNRPLLEDLASSTLQESMSEAWTREARSDGSEQGRFGFTVWTPTKLTTSVTVLYTNTSSTIRLSYFCSAAFVESPAAGCG